MGNHRDFMMGSSVFNLALSLITMEKEMIVNMVHGSCFFTHPKLITIFFLHRSLTQI